MPERERSQGCDVSVVVPLFRTADWIPELAARVRSTMTGLGASYELILVNDASPDNSLDVARQVASTDPAVGVLSLARNVGQQRAVLLGLEHAQGSWTIIMDGDLQDSPEAIEQLLEQGDTPFDAIFAGRRGRYESRSRLMTSRLFKLILHWLCGVPRDAGLFVALSRRMVEEIQPYRSSNPWVVAMIGLTGLPTYSVPVTRRRHRNGESSYTSWQRFRLGLGALSFAMQWRWFATPPVEIEPRMDVVESRYEPPNADP